MKCRSEWQRPATAVLIRTSRGPGLLMLTSSITNGLFGSNSTAAFMICSLFACAFSYCFRPINSVELNDAPHGLAGLHVGKAFVDLLKFDLGGDPVVEMQLA